MNVIKKLINPFDSFTSNFYGYENKEEREI